MIDAGIHGIFACVGYFSGFCGAHYSIFLIVLFVVVIDVRGFMKLVKPKNFVVL